MRAREEPRPRKNRATPMPLAVPAEPHVEIDDGEIEVTIGPRTYRVLNLEKCTSRGQMQVNVKVSGTNVRGEWCYHGDTFDMESFVAPRGVHQAGGARTGDEGRDDPSRGGPVVGGAADMQREMHAQGRLTPGGGKTAS